MRHGGLCCLDGIAGLKTAMPKSLPYALALLFAAYLPTVLWLDRSFVSTTPKGSIVIQILPPFETYNFASIPRREFIERISQFGADEKIKGDRRSPVAIYEDGRPLGPGHNTFYDVYHLGAGRFAHFKTDGIIFSSSDNSNPNTNGRKYWAVLP